MMLEEEWLRSELVFSVPKATLLCPSTAVRVVWDSHGCTEPVAGTRAALSQAIISFLNCQKRVHFVPGKSLQTLLPGFSLPGEV